MHHSLQNGIAICTQLHEAHLLVHHPAGMWVQVVGGSLPAQLDVQMLMCGTRVWEGERRTGKLSTAESM